MLSCLIGMTATSCVGDLLNQPPTTEVSSDLYWKSMDDATYALHGVYNATRTLFHKEYKWDTATDIMWGDIRVPYNGTWQPHPNVGSSNDTYSVFVEILCYFNYFEKVDSRAYYTRLAFRGMYRRKRI